MNPNVKIGKAVEGFQERKLAIGHCALSSFPAFWPAHDAPATDSPVNNFHAQQSPIYPNPADRPFHFGNPVRWKFGRPALNWLINVESEERSMGVNFRFCLYQRRDANQTVHTWIEKQHINNHGSIDLKVGKKHAPNEENLKDSLLWALR